MSGPSHQPAVWVLGVRIVGHFLTEHREMGKPLTCG